MGRPLTIAVDTEETGLEHFHGVKPFIVSTADETGKNKLWEFPVDPFTRKPHAESIELEEIAHRLEGNNLVFHNAKYDIRGFATMGVYLIFPRKIWGAGVRTLNWRLDSRKKPIIVECNDFDDTVLASQICYSAEDHDLKTLSFMYLDVPEDDQKALKEAVHSAGYIARANDWSLGHAPNGERRTDYDYWLPKAVDSKSTVAARYALRDAEERTLPLWYLLKSIMEEDPQLRKSYEEEKALLPVLYAMECVGVTISKARLIKIKRRLYQEKTKWASICRQIGQKILDKKDFNPNSPLQVSQLLHGFSVNRGKVTKVSKSLGIPVVKVTEKGSVSTDAETMEAIVAATYKRRRDPKYRLACKYALAHVFASKHETGLSYLKGYSAYGLKTDHPNYLRIHPSVNQTGTKLTRCSSSNPNSQNITSGDSGVGPGDPDYRRTRIPLRNLFGPMPGEVWYSIDYSQLELRILAYACNDDKMIAAFESGVNYHQMTADELGISKVNAKRINFRITYGGDSAFIDAVGGPGTYNRLASRFPRMIEYMKDMIRFVRKEGFIRTLSGRKIYLDPRRAKTVAVNGVVQGTAGEIIKRAQVRVAKLLDWQTTANIFQIHDELILKFPKRQSPDLLVDVCDEMVAAGNDLGVITTVEPTIIRTHWGDKQPFPLDKLVVA